MNNSLSLPLSLGLACIVGSSFGISGCSSSTKSNDLDRNNSGDRYELAGSTSESSRFASTNNKKFSPNSSAGKGSSLGADLYGTFGIGLASIQDADWNETIGGTKYTGDLSFDSGFAYQVGLGRKFGKNRVELTYAQGSGETNEITVDNAGSTGSISGDIYTRSIMLTAYRDFPQEKTKAIPYVGVGIGSTSVDVDNITVAGTQIGNADGSAFSYQIKAGLSYSMSAETDVFGEVTYLITNDLDIEGTDFETANSLSVMTGIRYQF